MPGAEVGARGAAAEPVGQERADIGQLERGAAGLRVVTRLREHVVEDAVELPPLPRLPLARGGERVGGGADRLGPPVDRLRRAQRVDRHADALDVLGQASRQVDRAALDVVERQDPRHELAALLGHRHPGEDPVEALSPRARPQAGELERPAVRPVESPADSAGGDPVLHLRQLVVVEAEPPADRLAGRKVEQLRRGRPLVGELEQLRDDGEKRIRLAQRAVGEPDAEVGKRRCVRTAFLIGLDRLGPGPAARSERGSDQRRERLDVRAHHDHVSRLERRILVEQVQDRVTQHLHLARPAVAAVDLDAAVVRLGRRAVICRVAGAGLAVRADVLLDPLEQGRGASRGRERMVVLDGVAGAGQDELELAGVPAPGGEQPVLGRGDGRVFVAPRHPYVHLAHRLPQDRGGVQHEHVHLALRRQRVQHAHVIARQAGQAEQRQTLGQVEQLGALPDALARAAQPLGRARLPDPRAQCSPELGLPPLARLPRPAAHHVRAVHAVTVEQVGDVAHDAEPPRRLVGVGASALQVALQRGQPWLLQARVDHLEQGPDRALGQPRIVVRLDAGRRGHRAEDEPARERELDVGAHAVVALRARRPEPRREPLGQPSLDPARRHRDDLGRERVRERLEQRVREPVRQAVGAFGSVDVEHPSGR